MVVASRSTTAPSNLLDDFFQFRFCQCGDTLIDPGCRRNYRRRRGGRFDRWRFRFRRGGAAGSGSARSKSHSSSAGSTAGAVSSAGKSHSSVSAANAGSGAAATARSSTSNPSTAGGAVASFLEDKLLGTRRGRLRRGFLYRLFDGKDKPLVPVLDQFLGLEHIVFVEGQDVILEIPPVGFRNRLG